MPGKLIYTEHPEVAEGPVEHSHPSVARELPREQKSVRLRHFGMYSRRQVTARRMVAVVRYRTALGG